MGAIRRGLTWVSLRSGGWLPPPIFLLLLVNTVVLLLGLGSARASGPPGLVAWLWAERATVFQGQVWRLLTASFAHADTMHWFWNMVLLFFFGAAVLHALGTRVFTGMILAAALACGIAQVSISDAPGLGFSGCDYAILVAFALLYPRRRILVALTIPVPAAVLVSLLVLVDLFMWLEGGHNIAHWGHLAGALVGLLTVRHRSGILGLWKRWRTRRLAARAERFRRIQDKVQREGLGALTKRERRFLERIQRIRSA